jgi:photosynthetic reaction center H subunit
MYNETFFTNVDVAAVVTALFVFFFIGLVAYLRREDRREGYPLEDDVSGRLEPSPGLFFSALPKTFILSHGHGTLTVPTGDRDSREMNARPSSRAAGSPLTPTGDPLLAGVGPGSYAHRAKRPDVTFHGEPKIGPLSRSPGYSLDPNDPQLVGMPVVGADGVTAGVIRDVWIDRAEFLIRYIEIETAGTGRRVLAPMPMAAVQRAKRRVEVRALLAAQFEGVPALENPEQITFDEEERVTAYFGAGLLYATPDRAEPYL